ncbi:hypothetical protein Golax_021275 [Gossypium laxum]|uniref:Oleosin n=1 Tax=Gossypium laxum TaxID=34288 RepID=A0A7J9AKK1_9ROSI|nr:hypothetical protein [Gossypium laxum]
MADRDRDPDRNQPQEIRLLHPSPHYRQTGPSTTQIVAVLTLLPVGGSLLALAALTLTGTLIGLSIAIPLFIIFSPVIVPATIAISMAVAGFLSSGAFGLTGLSSLNYGLKRMIRANAGAGIGKGQAKRGMWDMVGYVGQKTKDVGQNMENKAHEGGGAVRT